MDPLIFYRKKKGRKLILFLKKKIARKKWIEKGWGCTLTHLETVSNFEMLIFWNTQSSVVLTCSVREDRPDIILCNDTPNVYNLLLELLHGYPKNPLIEVVLSK